MFFVTTEFPNLYTEDDILLCGQGYRTCQEKACVNLCQWCYDDNQERPNFN
jgi:hypothetical protein